MQVAEHPTTDYRCHSGFFAGLTAEVMSAAVQGPYGYHLEGDMARSDWGIQCAIPVRDLFDHPTCWFDSATDVTGLRVVALAGTLDIWRHQHPMGYHRCDDVDRWWDEALGEVRTIFPTWDRPGDTTLQLWYGAPRIDVRCRMILC